MGFFRQTAPRPLMRTDAERAAESLGLTLDGLTEEHVRTRFRERVRGLHPDAATAPGHNAADEIARVMGARAKLLSWIADQPDPDCMTCNGTGVVPRGPLTTLCPRCGR